MSEQLGKWQVENRNEILRYKIEEKRDKVIIIAEIGINHGGDLDLAKKLINLAHLSGCDLVKFQKRDLDLVYGKETLESPRDSKWGKTTRDQKNGLEFNREQFDEIDRFCKEKGIEWFSSCWDISSLEFMDAYGLKYNKIASAILTAKPLLEEVAKRKKHTFISTGMSTMQEISECVEIFKKHQCSFELMHCNSSYPQKNEESNLLMIKTLRDKFGCKVGFSSHCTGLQVPVASSVLGTTSIEVHITLDRASEGSDQAASIEPPGLIKLVRDIRIIEESMGDGTKRIYESEKPIREKLVPYWYKQMLENENR